MNTSIIYTMMFIINDNTRPLKYYLYYIIAHNHVYYWNLNINFIGTTGILSLKNNIS